ncbi:MAG: AI-2E family transporter [Methanoregula sp.]
MSILRNDQVPFILMVILTLAAIVLFWPVMDMVLLAASLAVVLMPLHHRLSQRVRPVLSAAIVTAVVIGAGGIILWGTLTIFAANASTLTGMFSAIASWINDPDTSFAVFGMTLNKASFISLLTTGNLMFTGYGETLINNLALIAFKAFVFFFTLFILLLRGEELKKRMTEHMPSSLNAFVNRLSDVTVDTLYAIYVVQVAIAVLTFFIAIPVFYLLGYGNILFYSFFAAFCELIPILGASIAFLLIGAYALAIGDIQGVVILFVFGYLCVSCLPEIFVRPVLIGRRVKINPVIMFIGIIGGILTMGLAGFVLGPVLVVLLITSYRLYVQDQKEHL